MNVGMVNIGAAEASDKVAAAAGKGRYTQSALRKATKCVDSRLTAVRGTRWTVVL